METLRERKIDDQTVIALIGDNGGSLVTYAVNDPLKGGKYTLFEGGTRVPMWIRAPGLKPGLSSRVVSSLDLLPTLTQLAKAKLPASLDGMNLLAPDDGAVRTLYWDTGFEESVRRGPWKWLHTKSTPNSALQITPTPAGTFLYNLEADPGESTDVRASHPEIANELASAFKKWKQEVTPAGKVGGEAPVPGRGVAKNPSPANHFFVSRVVGSLVEGSFAEGSFGVVSFGAGDI